MKERWTVIKDGERHEFAADVVPVATFAEPCPCCGAYCTGLYRLWYMQDGKRMTFSVDRARFDHLLESAFPASGWDSKAYSRLPRFLRDWNELSGWRSDEHVDGAQIDTGDILAALDLAETMAAGDATLVNALNGFICQCSSSQATLRITED